MKTRLSNYKRVIYIALSVQAHDKEFNKFLFILREIYLLLLIEQETNMLLYSLKAT